MIVYKTTYKEPFGKLVDAVVGIKLLMEKTFLYGQLIHGNIG
jgi:hypothetical protein